MGSMQAHEMERPQRATRILSWLLALTVSSLVMWIAEASRWSTLTADLVLAGVLIAFVTVVVPLASRHPRRRARPPRSDRAADALRRARATQVVAPEDESSAADAALIAALEAELTRSATLYFPAESSTMSDRQHEFQHQLRRLLADKAALMHLAERVSLPPDVLLHWVRKQALPRPVGGGPREPWPGYAKLNPDQRQAELDTKFAAAKDQGDQAYAFALAAAVANYEQVQKLQPDTEHSEPVADKARELHGDAGGWIGS